MSEQLRTDLKNMIVERLFLNVSPDEIEDDENLLDEYNIDSVNLFEIVLGLEEEFEIELEEEDFNVETFSTVTNIARFVQKKQES